MEQIILRDIDVKKNSLNTLINAFHKPSINGLKVELFDDKNMNKEHVLTFMPSLSSLYLMAQVPTKNANNSIEKKTKIIEYHEEQPPFKRRPLSM